MLSQKLSCKCSDCTEQINCRVTVILKEIKKILNVMHDNIDHLKSTYCHIKHNVVKCEGR